MDQYDEDLFQNPFFQNLKNTYHTLFDLAADKRWTICIPRIGSLSDLDLVLDDIENHILVPQEEDVGTYKTVSKKEVTIKSSIIATGRGFTEHREVPILFEETFFNNNEESYCILCTNQPLEGGDNCVDFVPDRPVYSFTNRSAEECANLLWGTTGNQKTRKQLSALIDAFHKRLNNMKTCSLKELMGTTRSFFDKAMTVVMKDPYMKQASWKDDVFMESVRLAVETHLMYGVHKRLFKMICTCQSRKDSQLNKITRNLSHIQLQHLGVRIEYCQNVPRARKELSNLSLHRTPVGKINCIKRVVTALTRPSQQSLAVGPVPLTTDDLLPILVFLVLKADIPNWWSHFEHISSFRFSKSCKDNEYGFYLASIEAALEHVSCGSLLDLECNHHLDPHLPVLECPEPSLWHKQDQDSQAIDQLFQYVKDKNKAAVLEVLRKAKSRQARLLKGAALTSDLPLCHPLCSCDKCRSSHPTGDKKTENLVNVHSRDAKGYTVLHIAAFYGLVEMADIALKNGALVNGSDYLGQTPLHISCKKGHQAVTLLLLHHGAMVNATDGESNTALHVAALHGHEDCIKALVFFDQGGGDLNINAMNDFGDTALHLATKWGYYSLVCFLLENGASPAIKNRKHYEPIRYAHNTQLSDVLEEAMVDQARKKMMAKQAFRKTESFHDFGAVRRGCAPKSLPSRVGSDLTRSASVIQTPQQQTQLPGSSLTRTVSEANLPRRGSLTQPTMKRRSSDTPDTGGSLASKKIDKLLRAVADGDLNMAKFHLGWISESDDEDTSDLDLSQHELCHPLCQCVKCHPVQKFMAPSSKSSVHMNSQDIHGYTPLHVAAHNGHEILVKLLLRRGANVNLPTNNDQSSALHLACKQRKLELLQSLLNHGAEINAQDTDGNTPLHCSCVMGNEKKADLLIKHNAQINISNKKGNTPLHDAVRWNFINVVRLLLKHGARPQSRNSEHKLPLHYAQTEDMCHLLRKAMASKKPSTAAFSDSSNSFEMPELESNDKKPPKDHGNLFSPKLKHTEPNHSKSRRGLSMETENQSDPKKISSNTAECKEFKTITADSHDCSTDSGICPKDCADAASPVVNEHASSDPSKGEPTGYIISPSEIVTDGCIVIPWDIDVKVLAQASSCHGSRLVLIDNYYDDGGISDKLKCSVLKCHHDNCHDSDCCSENSNTESQQDLSIEEEK